jgi:hypothetical protein
VGSGVEVSTKDTNPKDAVGTGKAPCSTVSAVVIAEVGLAMLEGARKYGRHNYRVSGVRASVYYDAVKNRHLSAWWEGEDDDPDSALSHITKAIAGLVVLRDSMIQGNWIDDRPPPSPKGWLEKLNAKAADIVAKYPDAKEPFLANDSPADVDRKLGRSAPEPERNTLKLNRSTCGAELDGIGTGIGPCVDVPGHPGSHFDAHGALFVTGDRARIVAELSAEDLGEPCQCEEHTGPRR